MRNERRSLDELQALQSKKLQRLVTYAYENVPFYRNLYDTAGVHPTDIRSVEDIVKLPVIDKNDLRNAPLGMWMDKRLQNKNKLVRLTTSGSSGSPMAFYISRQCDHVRKAQFLRPLITNGRGLFDSLVRLTYRDELPFKWFQRIGLLREYRISVLKSSQEKIERITQIKPDILYGYPSMLNELAHGMRARGIQYSPKLIFSDSELLLHPVRKFISETFHADVIDIYGTYEIDNVAYECREHRGFHIAIDHVVMEFIHDGVPVAARKEGEIVCTVLDNFT
jgi:phenylacetate-CoA ligase